MQNILFFLKKYAKDIVIFALLLVCLGLIIYKYFEPTKEVQNTNSLALLEKSSLKEEKEEISEPVDNYIYVDVKGAVKKPGVYQVLDTAIINDVVNLAGGFTSNAYKNNVNLSKRVCPEMVIYIYTKSEINNNKVTPTTNSTQTSVIEKEQPSNNPTNTKETPVKTDTTSKTDSGLGSVVTTETQKEPCQAATYDITKCVEESISIIETPASDSCNTNDKEPNKSEEKPTENTDTKPADDKNKTSLININNANVSELTTLSGIGEAKAQKIISYREENGNFKSINDIMNVSGIGEKLFEQIKENITV